MSNEDTRRILSDFLQEEGGSEEWANDIFGFSPLHLGEKYYVRGAIYSLIGRVIFINEEFVQFDDVSFVCKDGSYTDFVNNGPNTNSTLEPIDHPMTMNRDMIHDFVVWKHPLNDRN